MVMTVKLPMKLYTNFRLILTVGSSGFGRISETTSLKVALGGIRSLSKIETSIDNKLDLHYNLRRIRFEFL